MALPEYVLGIDIGTTSTSGIIIEPSTGRVLTLAERPVALHSPKTAWAEQDPALWWRNACEICQELTREAPARTIKAVGVSGMVPALVLLDENGQLLRPSIQQSDGRAAEEIEEMRAEADEASFLGNTGQGINQQLTGPKIRWLEKHEPEVMNRTATILGSYDYINWRLTGQLAVERNWALEGGLLRLRETSVNPDLAALAHLRPSQIPPVATTSDILGGVTSEAAKLSGLAPGTPVIGGCADHIASALAAGITRSGDVLVKLGGAIDILTATKTAKPDPRLFLDLHLVPGLYMPNGCMSTGGSGCRWFAETFCGAEYPEARKAGATIYQRMDLLAALLPPGSEGVSVLPYFLGEKTPLHDPLARGLITGLSLGHGLGHIWRALLEAYGYAIRHHFEVFADIGYDVARVFVSDGGSSSSLWVQIIADILGRPIQCLVGHPGSCLGAAWTAAMGINLTGNWHDIERFVGRGKLVQPDSANFAIYQEGYRTFRELYRKNQN